MDKHTFGFHFLVVSFAFAVVFSLFLSSNSFFTPLFNFTSDTEASSSHNMSGFAWGDNIGWVSFNCTTPLAGGCGSSNYGVNLDPLTGNFSGYAWANPQDSIAPTNNIGWVAFNASEVAGCPAGTCEPRLSGNEVLGWARACTVFQSGCSGALKPSTETGGWDGWISLNCQNNGSCGTSNYKVNLNGSQFEGQAWGGDVVGWLYFNCLSDTSGSGCSSGNYSVVLNATPPQITSFFPTPTAVSPGGSSVLEWSSTGATSCTASGGWSGSKLTSGTQSVGPLSVDTSFTLTCSNLVGGQDVDNTLVTIIPDPDFSITSSNNLRLSSLSLGSSSTTLRISPVNGFGSTVSVSVAPSSIGGVPVTYSLSDNSLNSAEYTRGSSLTIESSALIPEGNYSVTVTGVGGGLTRQTVISLVVSTSTRRLEEF